MKFRYTIEVLTYDGRTLHRTIEADDISYGEFVLKFVTTSDGWIPIAIYPANKTIVTKIEKLK